MTPAPNHEGLRLASHQDGVCPEVSVVMPCLNEARTVGRCVEKAAHALAVMGVRGEVIVADNGSTDGSQELARERGARVVEVSRRGYGAALQAGIAAAGGRYVIMGDADDSYDFTRLEPFVEKLRMGYDLVMGNRFKGGIMPGAMPWHHKWIGNPVLSGILNLFYRSPIGDAHCGLRGFSKPAYERLGLSCTGMEFASEMVVKACLHRQRLTEVPIVLHPDGRDRPPHLRSFRDGWRHLRFLLILCPLWLYLIPSIALIAVGLGLMLWLTPGPRQLGGVVIDVHTMLFGSLMIIVGWQTIWLWAFARVYGWLSGLLPPDTFSENAFRRMNLERGLLAGGASVLIGLILIAFLVYHWTSRGLGPLDLEVTIRQALWAFTATVVGVQTIYGSFFLSMLGMRHQL